MPAACRGENSLRVPDKIRSRRAQRRAISRDRFYRAVAPGDDHDRSVQQAVEFRNPLGFQLKWAAVPQIPEIHDVATSYIEAHHSSAAGISEHRCDQISLSLPTVALDGQRRPIDGRQRTES